MPNFLSQAQELFPYTQTLRRDFHIHPELGFNEIRTGGIVAHELEALDMEVTKGVGKTGVVGLLEGSKPGPTLLLRFDMDALPIAEETGAEYASQNPGVMHACGLIFPQCDVVPVLSPILVLSLQPSLIN